MKIWCVECKQETVEVDVPGNPYPGYLCGGCARIGVSHYDENHDLTLQCRECKRPMLFDNKGTYECPMCDFSLTCHPPASPAFPTPQMGATKAAESLLQNLFLRWVANWARTAITERFDSEDSRCKAIKTFAAMADKDLLRLKSEHQFTERDIWEMEHRAFPWRGKGE